MQICLRACPSSKPISEGGSNAMEAIKVAETSVCQHGSIRILQCEQQH